MIKPAYEKFKRYCISKNYGTDEYIKSLYDYLDERKWKKANGEEPVNWMILTDANFGVFNAKGKFSRAIREKMAEKSDNFDPVEPFPDNGMNYVAYTDGSCDNHSKYRLPTTAWSCLLSSVQLSLAQMVLILIFILIVNTASLCWGRVLHQR